MVSGAYTQETIDRIAALASLRSQKGAMDSFVQAYRAVRWESTQKGVPLHPRERMGTGKRD